MLSFLNQIFVAHQKTLPPSLQSDVPEYLPGGGDSHQVPLVVTKLIAIPTEVSVSVLKKHPKDVFNLGIEGMLDNITEVQHGHVLDQTEKLYKQVDEARQKIPDFHNTILSDEASSLRFSIHKEIDTLFSRVIEDSREYTYFIHNLAKQVAAESYTVVATIPEDFPIQYNTVSEIEGVRSEDYARVRKTVWVYSQHPHVLREFNRMRFFCIEKDVEFLRAKHGEIVRKVALRTIIRASKREVLGNINLSIIDPRKKTMCYGTVVVSEEGSIKNYLDKQLPSVFSASNSRIIKDKNVSAAAAATDAAAAAAADAAAKVLAEEESQSARAGLSIGKKSKKPIPQFAAPTALGIKKNSIKFIPGPEAAAGGAAARETAAGEAATGGAAATPPPVAARRLPIPRLPDN